MTSRLRLLLVVLVLLVRVAGPAAAQHQGAAVPDVEARISAIEGEMLAWRRHLHANPELSNREAETARYIAARLREFGLEPRTGVARHGVTAVLRGARPGPVVALRADMDGLPVTEETDLPFASRATGEYGGRTVGVMHACGHDAHMAMLLGTAKILAGVRDRLPGAVVLIFQPAEEGVPVEEQPAGAQLMVSEGVLQDPRVDAIFGLHVFANIPSGHVAWRRGPVMAAADRFEILVRGTQTHGANPWQGVDPIVTASQIVMALQTIVSRSLDITQQPAVVTVGQFEAGVRNNIIPDSARLVGTIRTFDPAMRADIHARMKRIAGSIAEAAGGTAEVIIEPGYPVTANDPALTERMLPTLHRVLEGRVQEGSRLTTAEDFSYFQQQVPGLFLMLGITPPAQVGKAPANHSPRFTIDEPALLHGVRTLTHLALDYLEGAAR